MILTTCILIPSAIPEPIVYLAEPSTIGLVVASLVVSVGVSFLASKLSKKRSRSTVEDSKPTVLADRGSFTSWIGAGRRRVGFVFAWAGNRSTKKEKVSGGKGGLIGGAAEKVVIHFEDGWHILGVGVGLKLWSIKASGEFIWVGPITRDSHPSGTTVDAGKFGSFTVYWGELDQPINISLGDVSRVGVSSRWPGCFYIEWTKFRMGQVAVWDFIDYEVEVDFNDVPTLPSDPFDPPTRQPFGLTPLFGPHTVVSATDGGPGVAKIEIGVPSFVYDPGLFLRLAGNSADDDYEILSFEILGSFPTQTTEITLNDTLTGSNSSGTTELLDELDNDGWSPIHSIYKLLFFDHPFGLGLDPSDFNTTDLDNLALFIRSEGITGSVIGLGGESARSILGKVMMDLGIFLHWDSTLGHYSFTAFRETSITQQIPEDMLMAPIPERTKLSGPKKRDKLMFKFSDRQRGFRDNTVAIDADEESNRVGRQKPVEIEISAIVNYDSASKIAERRSQEEFARAQNVSVNVNRAARLLNPGQKIALGPAFDESLRILGVQLKHLTGHVVFKCVNDFYGFPNPAFNNQQGGGLEGTLLPVAPDIAFDFFEVPSYLTVIQLIITPRIRAHLQIQRAGIHFSVDDITFNRVDTETDTQSGGVLLDAFPAGDSFVATGPTFTLQGLDDDVFQDLTLDEPNWRVGRQWVVLEDEIMFVQKITALGGTTYRLDNVLRARFDTVKVLHSIGAQLYVFNPTDVLAINDLLLSFNTVLFVKTQPETSESIPLDQVTSKTRTLLGKGVAPMLPLNLKTTRVQGRTRVYETGDDITFEWAYRSNEVSSTGAGLQNAGQAVGVSAIQGVFLLEITDLSDVIKRSFTSVAGLTQLYTNAQLVSDFSGEPASFKAKLRNINGGFQSPQIEETIVKL